MKIMFLLSILSSLTFLKADVIIIATDEWCPYACSVENKNQGYMVDIARAVFEPLGHTVIYKVMPWSRAVALAEHGKVTAVLGALKEDTPDFIFPQTNQGESKNSLCLKKNNTWQYENIDSFSQVKLGVMGGYAYGKEIDKYIKNNKNKTYNIVGETPLVLAFRLLKRQRIDMFIEDPLVLYYNINKYDFINDFKVIDIQNSADPVYIAFSPKLQKSKNYAKTLDEGMQSLRKSGKLQMILSRYNLKDWQ